MKTSSFSFDLPEHLIAQYPSDKRGESRLLVAHNSNHFTSTQDIIITHSNIEQITRYLPQNSLLVFNDSRVRKARIYGKNIETGSNTEFLLIEQTGNPRVWKSMARKAKKQTIGKSYTFPNGIFGEIIATENSLRLIQFNKPISDAYLDIHGHIPLPPYIERPDDKIDETRYQTVYSRKDHIGSVAAPTAGLHFTPEILQSIEAAGHQICYVTLHVGLGTFLPVRTDEVEQHTMHTEHYVVPKTTASLINKAKEVGNPIIAIGTTSIRTIESAWNKDQNKILPGEGTTNIFIYPGYKFNVVDGIFTNFHTPESTLLMLVSAFAGVETIKSIYKTAIEEKYHFFSYGDAMLLLE
jgi:S-adenosylmethionine:tRNA ribosyltransferase-isomerase